MKLLIQKEDLLYAVGAVERAVSGKNTLPVLSGILISAADNQARFRATDLEMAMECVVNAEVIEAGEAVAPGRKFSAMARLLPGGGVTLESSGETLRVSYTGGRQNLPCFAADEFPVLPARSGELEGAIPVRVFRRMARQVGVAAAADEVRPVFTGVYTELRPDSLLMVATDTHRLAKGMGPWQGGGEANLIIPNRTVQEVARLAGNDDDEIMLLASKNQAYFTFANLTVTSRLIVGQYPDYRQVIPDEGLYQSELVVGRQALIEVLERAALLVREASRSRGNVVRLTLEENELAISAEAPDEGALREALPAAISGERIAIHYNARYLLDALKVIEEERVRIRLTGPSTPGLILPDTEAADPNYLYLLLPVRVTR